MRDSVDGRANAIETHAIDLNRSGLDLDVTRPSAGARRGDWMVCGCMWVYVGEDMRPQLQGTKRRTLGVEEDRTCLRRVQRFYRDFPSLVNADCYGFSVKTGLDRDTAESIYTAA